MEKTLAKEIVEIVEVPELALVENGLTEKGNLKRDAHKQMKAQAVDALLDGFELTPKGQYVKAIATVDGNGHKKTAYVVMDLSVTVGDALFDEPKAKRKATKADDADVVVPTLL